MCVAGDLKCSYLSKSKFIQNSMSGNVLVVNTGRSAHQTVSFVNLEKLGRLEGSAEKSLLE